MDNGTTSPASAGLFSAALAAFTVLGLARLPGPLWFFGPSKPASRPPILAPLRRGFFCGCNSKMRAEFSDVAALARPHVSALSGNVAMLVLAGLRAMTLVGGSSARHVAFQGHVGTPPATLHYRSARPVRLRCRDAAPARRATRNRGNSRVSKQGSENICPSLTRTSRMFALGFVPVSEMGYDSRADRKEIIDIR